MKLSKNHFVVGAVAIMTTLTLAACGNSSGGDPSATPSDRPSEEASPSASPSETPSESPTEKPVASAPQGTPGELTPPGTILAFGESAVTHANNDNDHSAEDYTEATFTTSVSKIVVGSPDDLSVFEDAAKFAGQTPYYVHMDVRLDSLTRPNAGIALPRVDAHLKDGSEAQQLMTFGSFDQCEDGHLETEGEDDTFTYKVGSSTTTCTIFLAPAGDAVTSASFADMSYSYEKFGDNPYLDAPIVWK